MAESDECGRVGRFCARYDLLSGDDLLNMTSTPGADIPTRLGKLRGSDQMRPESMFLHVTVLIVVGVLLTAGLITVAWFLFGRPASPSDRVDLVKVALVVVGGVGGVVALTVAYRKQRQGEVGDRRERDKVFTDRYVKATEQLGHQHPSVRVAGVYAMAELADDWDDGRQLCINVLCAHVRMPYQNPDDGEREVRRTLFRIIRDHLRPDARFSLTKWSGYRFSFEGATLDKGDLSGIHLTTGGHMTFHGARFIGSFHLGGLHLHDGAALWFTEAIFDGDVTFDKANFQGSKVSLDRAIFASGLTTFADVQYDAVEDHDSEQVRTGLTRVGAECTGGTVNWGTIPPLPLSTTP